MKGIIFWLKIALSAVFLWFGALKMAGFNPVYNLVMNSFPFFADGIGLFSLGLVEVLIGAGLLFNFYPKAILVILVAHLLGTFSVFLISPSVLFEPYFPILNLEGEFVFKNIVLLLAGLAVLHHRASHEK